MYIGTSGGIWVRVERFGKWKCRKLVAQSCLTLCDPMDYSPPGSSVHGIFQARVLEWVAIFFSRGSSQPRDRTWVSHIVSRRFTHWATREVMNIYFNLNFKLITNIFFFFTISMSYEMFEAHYTEKLFVWNWNVIGVLYLATLILVSKWYQIKTELHCKY